jgi:hypothetical protein
LHFAPLFDDVGSIAIAALEREWSMSKFTPAEKAAEIEREIDVRVRIYSRSHPGRRDKLSATQLRRVEILEEIAREYREQAERERSGGWL